MVHASDSTQSTATMKMIRELPCCYSIPVLSTTMHEGIATVRMPQVAVPGINVGILDTCGSDR